MRELDLKSRDELLEPDQKVTNYIWKTIVVTFAVVLCGATAGILAGFVSGRASTVSRAR